MRYQRFDDEDRYGFSAHIRDRRFAIVTGARILSPRIMRARRVIAHEIERKAIYLISLSSSLSSASSHRITTPLTQTRPNTYSSYYPARIISNKPSSRCNDSRRLSLGLDLAVWSNGQNLRRNIGVSRYTRRACALHRADARTLTLEAQKIFKNIIHFAIGHYLIPFFPEGQKLASSRSLPIRFQHV